MDSLHAFNFDVCCCLALNGAGSIPQDIIYCHPLDLELAEVIKAVHIMHELA